MPRLADAPKVRLLHVGVDGDTPPELVDRVLFSNFVLFVGSILNITLGLANLNVGYHVLAALNAWYQVAFTLGFFLNHKHRYVAARAVFLTMFYAGMAFACAIQGQAAQMEH